MGSCAAPSAKGDDKFITTDYLQQCLRLNVGIEVPHQVTFVTSHITFGAEIVNAVLINKVLIAFALFGHRLVIKAGGDGVRDKTAVIVVCPARGFVE